MQSVMGMYFANGFFDVRDWDHPGLGRLGWAACSLFSLQAVQSIFHKPGSTLTGYVTIFIILLIAVTVLLLTKKSSEATAFRRSRLLDVLVTFHVALGLGAGFLCESTSNLVKTRFFIIWSIVFGLIIVLYRFGARNTITV